MEKELKICEMYEQGKKVSEITKECKCSTNTISKVIEKYGIPKRQIKNLDKDISKFFELDKEETQYWIGYICADGNIQYDFDNRNYTVSLYSKEMEPLLKFQKYFGKDIVKIHITKTTGMIKAYINSKKLCEYFIETLNITPRKSKDLNPNIEFTNHFIRGYFDGDGCIVNSNYKRIRHEANITSGCKSFLEKIKTILDNEGIYSILYQYTNCDAFKIRIDRKEDSEKLYYYLY